MNTPAIIAFGAASIGEYTTTEYDAALARAFQRNPDGFVVLDSNPRGQRFLAACAAWAIDQGLLRVAQVADDGQCEFCSLRLTPTGKARYGSGGE